jgi:prepilin signal peptidase PulO-like enzyme (type II secretory pathway)
MFSSVFGAFAGLLAVAFKKNRIGDFIEIPFGPYIVLANLLWMFSGPQIVEAYLSLIKV